MKSNDSIAYTATSPCVRSKNYRNMFHIITKMWKYAWMQMTLKTRPTILTKKSRSSTTWIFFKKYSMAISSVRIFSAIQRTQTAPVDLAVKIFSLCIPLNSKNLLFISKIVKTFYFFFKFFIIDFSLKQDYVKHKMLAIFLCMLSSQISSHNICN